MEYKDSRQFPLSLTVGIRLLQLAGFESGLKAICPDIHKKSSTNKVSASRLVLTIVTYIESSVRSHWIHSKPCIRGCKHVRNDLNDPILRTFKTC